MVFPYSKIVGSAVIEIRSQQKVGEVFDLIYQQKDFKISGIVLQYSGFFSSKKMVVSYTDIIQIAKDVVIINNADSVTSLSENVRLSDAIKNKQTGIDQRVITRSGKKIGRVYDYLVSDDTLSVTKIYVKSLLSEKIIPFSAIWKIEKNKIIINDDYNAVRIPTPVVETSII